EVHLPVAARRSSTKGGRGQNHRLFFTKDVFLDQRTDVERRGVQRQPVAAQLGPIDHALVRIGDNCMDLHDSGVEAVGQTLQRAFQVFSPFQIVVVGNVTHPIGQI